MRPAVNGFTLIELMITLSIAAILLTVAVPSFQEMLSNNRMSSSQLLFLNAINAARRAAIDHGATGTICASDGGVTCNTTDWTKGWIVHVDRNGDNALDPSEIIVVKDDLPPTLQIQNVPSNTIVDQIVFSSTGVLTPPGTTLIFYLCESGRSGETGRRINISAGGRARREELTCS